MNTKAPLYIKEPTNCICATLENIEDVKIAEVDTFHSDWKDTAARIIKSYNSYDELTSLLDGVTEVVELFKTESPAQEKWKADWLQRARTEIAKAEGK